VRPPGVEAQIGIYPDLAVRYDGDGRAPVTVERDWREFRLVVPVRLAPRGNGGRRALDTVVSHSIPFGDPRPQPYDGPVHRPEAGLGAFGEYAERVHLYAKVTVGYLRGDRLLCRQERHQQPSQEHRLLHHIHDSSDFLKRLNVTTDKDMRLTGNHINSRMRVTRMELISRSK